jgi:F-type H+-transporting ATPase subunit a
MTLTPLALVLSLLAQAHGAPHEAPMGEPAHAAAHGEAAHGQTAHAGGHHGAEACAAATPLQRCQDPSLCATHDDTVAGHIFHHVSDEVYYPLCFQAGEKVVDLSISKHVVWMWIASGLLLVAFLIAVGKRSVVPKGLYSLLESFVVFIRDEIAVKNIGEHDAHRYVGYLCTVFFFILFMNLVSLFPGGSAATGNLSVTVVLALCTFVVTQVAGMRAQGIGGYWLHLVPSGVPKWLWPIMFPVEILGLFAKPFALTVRLFANMVAGHIVIFFLLALTVLISVYVAPVSVAFALGIFLLELFVALVQAYVFTLLSALFIGMASHAH